MEARLPPTAAAAPRCSACLSTTRRVTELGALQKIYDMLVGDCEHGNENVKQSKPVVCWECKATFKRVHLFKIMVHKARNFLLQLHNSSQKSESSECLSSFCCTPTTVYEYNVKCSAEQIVEQLSPKQETIKMELPDLELNDSQSIDNEMMDSGLITGVQNTKCFEVFYTADNSDNDTLFSLRQEKIKLENDGRVLISENLNVNKATKKKRAKVKKKVRKEENNEPPVPLVKKEIKTKWSCNTCAKSFETRGKLTYHQRTVHAEPVLCNECGKVFNFKPSLEKHMLTHFGGLPKYPCAICGKSFAGRAGVKSHMVHVHCDPAARVYRCEPCDLTFKTVYKYRGHVKWSRKHGGIGTERHECEVCHRRYKTKRRLFEHHSYAHLGRAQHECHICNKKISSQLGLQKHLRFVHERRELPRTHVCEVCGDAFRRASLLRQHCYIHTGEKPHGCGVCGVKFRQKGSLYTHTKLAHRKPPAKLL